MLNCKLIVGTIRAACIPGRILSPAEASLEIGHVEGPWERGGWGSTFQEKDMKWKWTLEA